MIETVISWNGHTFAPDYEVDFVQGTEPNLPPGTAETLERIGAWPVIAALKRNPHSMALLVKILDYTNLDALRTQLFRWFDPEDETPKKLIAENHANVQMYRYALCANPGLQLYKDPRHQEVFIVTLAVDGDVRWRAETEDSDSWAITASGQTHAVANGGEDDAYPVYTIEPTTAKGAGYAYRRWVPVKWLSANAGTQYPLCATLDTATPVGAGKMQADGDDLRVLVDGLEVNRWLDAMNSAATKIWFNLDFAPSISVTLKTAIAGAGAVSSIELVEDISRLPDSGILYIGTEAFVYSQRSTIDRAVTGIERAAKGTSAGAHNIGDTAYLIQHDVYLLYGNAAAAAPTIDNDYQPAFELDHSTNTSWVYEVFGDSNGKRAGRWDNIGMINVSGWEGRFDSGGCFTEHPTALASPYTAIGGWLAGWNNTQGQAYGWSLSNPCGITNIDTLGFIYRDNASFLCHLMYWPRGASWWSWASTPALPPYGAATAWNYSGAAFAASNTVAFAVYFYNRTYADLTDVTVTLNAAETPVVSVGSEQGNYHLQCTLTNTTTGEAIALDLVMDVNSGLEIDTGAKVVTWLLDGSRQFQALTITGTRATLLAKRAWLRLLPGSNTLRFDDTSTGNVTLTTEFRERYY